MTGVKDPIFCGFAFAMTASSATLSTWKRDAPATLFPQQDRCNRELGATDFLESGALEKWLEADRRRSRSEVWFNRFERVAKVSDTRKTREECARVSPGFHRSNHAVQAVRSHAAVSTLLSTLHDHANFAHKTQRKTASNTACNTIHSRAGRCSAPSKSNTE
jgi:hypothetical protein